MLVAIIPSGASVAAGILRPLYRRALGPPVGMFGLHYAAAAPASPTPAPAATPPATPMAGVSSAAELISSPGPPFLASSKS